jgi:hypothetical protein
MWFLPTRGRPLECIELIRAMAATGDVPEVAVMIDDDPAIYRAVEWPAHWHVHVAHEHMELTRAVNTLLSLHPGRDCYGLFGDHFRPLTPMFEQLRAAAGDWFIAWPSDGGEMSHVEPSGAPTFGAKLVDLLGWICLPTTIHIATERVWSHLWRELGIVRHVEGAHFTRTWPVGRGRVPRDFHGIDFNDCDSLAWKHWHANDAVRVVTQIRAAMRADGYAFAGNGVIAPEYGCTRFRERTHRGGTWQRSQSFKAALRNSRGRLRPAPRP